VDTRVFDALQPEEYKAQTERHWRGDPCGSNYSTKEYMSAEYFAEIEAHRYSSHPWILQAIRSFRIRGLKALEIGYGMGTDHLNLARQGGEMYGIDLTPQNREITARHLELDGKSSELRTGDAERLPYEDGSFDFVYSFGVVHHSPDTEGIIREIRRVLRPHGRCYVTVYHKHSLFFLWTLLTWEWTLHGGFRKESLKARLSRIEYPNDDPNLVIRLYGRREFARLFRDAGFRRVRATIEHVAPEDVAVFGHLIPRRLREALGKQLGWYVVIDAAK
jgi:ubiquinone/menaquinone biosynthesis C-methylase UbiE